MFRILDKTRAEKFNADPTEHFLAALQAGDDSGNNETPVTAQTLAQAIKEKYDRTPAWARSGRKRTVTVEGDGSIDDGYRFYGRNETNEIEAMKKDGWEISDEFMKRHSKTWLFARGTYFRIQEYASWLIEK